MLRCDDLQRSDLCALSECHIVCPAMILPAFDSYRSNNLLLYKRCSRSLQFCRAQILSECRLRDEMMFHLHWPIPLKTLLLLLRLQKPHEDGLSFSDIFILECAEIECLAVILTLHQCRLGLATHEHTRIAAILHSLLQFCKLELRSLGL